MSMSFGDAVHYLKFGGSERRVSRAGWNGKGMWIALQRPDAHSKMGLPYLYMSTVDGKLVPWLASQTDILSDDWEIAEIQLTEDYAIAIKLCNEMATGKYMFGEACKALGVDYLDDRGRAELARQAYWSIPYVYDDNDPYDTRGWAAAAKKLASGWKWTP